jgi:iron complex outermembrane receptor protein
MNRSERERSLSAAFRRQPWLLASVAALSLGAPAYAQEADNEDEQAEETTPRSGGDILVTAERRVTNLQDTPISLLAVTGDIAEAKGIETLEDLSKFTPNLSITPTRGGGNNTANFVIRGIGGGGGATGERRERCSAATRPAARSASSASSRATCSKVTCAARSATWTGPT